MVKEVILLTAVDEVGQIQRGSHDSGVALRLTREVFGQDFLHEYRGVSGMVQCVW